MKGELMKNVVSNHLTSTQQAELAELDALPEAKIDTRDIPEQRDWRGARRGMFYRPIKQQITLRLDAETIDWFKQHNSHGYQTCINRVLHEYVVQHERDDQLKPPQRVAYASR
jgi:uncharacterized protein (DUF4415 family)